MASTTINQPELATPPRRGKPSRQQSNGTRAARAPLTDEEIEEAERQQAAPANPPAVETEASITLSRKPEEFFEQLSGFSSDDWQYLIAYVYRTAPTIDRRQNGRATNIRKYVDFFDTDRLMKEHGSGGYRIDLCRRNPTTGKSPRIGQVYLDILNLDYPPRVPIGDWIDEPENDIWKWAKPSLEHAAATGHFQADQPDPNKMFDTVLAGIERLRGTGNNGDGVAAATITGLTGLVTALIERPVPQAPAPDNSATNQIIQFLQTELSETRKEIRSMREAQRTEQSKGLFEQLKEIVPVVKDVSAMFGFKAGAGSIRTNWGDVVTEVVDKLSENAPILYDMYKTAKGGDGAPAGGGFKLPAAAQQQQAAQPPQGAQTQQQTESGQEATTVPDEKRKRYQAILAKWGKLIETVAPIMLDNFRRLKTGYEFRDWLMEVHGMANYSQLRLEVSAQELTELTQLHTFLRTVMQPPDKVLVFFTEFLTEPGQEPPGSVIEDEAKEQ